MGKYLEEALEQNKSSDKFNLTNVFSAEIYFQKLVRETIANAISATIFRDYDFCDEFQDILNSNMKAPDQLDFMKQIVEYGSKDGSVPELICTDDLRRIYTDYMSDIELYKDESGVENENIKLDYADSVFFVFDEFVSAVDENFDIVQTLRNHLNNGKDLTLDKTAELFEYIIDSYKKYTNSEVVDQLSYELYSHITDTLQHSDLVLDEIVEKSPWVVTIVTDFGYDFEELEEALAKIKANDEHPELGVINFDLKENRFYRGNQKDGLFECWFSDGQLYYRVNHKDSQKEGLYEVWYENGQLWRRENYKSGELDGLSEEWFRNGKLKRRTNYVNGTEVPLQKTNKSRKLRL